MNVALWHISRKGPLVVEPSEIDLEKHLEDWIEKDPAMVEKGLEVIGRQLRTDGGPLDLLAIDPQGRLVVIEIKPATLYRESFAQALDYAACIARMPLEDLAPKVDQYLERRDGKKARTLAELLKERGTTLSSATAAEETGVRICLVGTARHAALRRIVEFFGDRCELPISAVTFRVFALASRQRVLVRELTESETEPTGPRPALQVEETLARADKAGTGTLLRKIHSTATEVGLYARPWKASIMFTPPQNHTRCLFTVWTDPRADGRLNVYVATDAFEQFYGIPAKQVAEKLGLEGWEKVAPDALEAALKLLVELLTSQGEEPQR